MSCDPLDAALDRSPVAFAYFDPSDRLRFWNTAYVRLNFSITELIRDGAVFSDLLAELIVRGQIDVPDGDTDTWIEHRLARRREGGTDFRHLSDGRTFIVEECHDPIGGTLGFWIDVTHLFAAGALARGRGGSVRVFNGLADHGCQNALREHMQRVVGALEVLQQTGLSDAGHSLTNDALSALDVIRTLLDRARPRPMATPSSELHRPAGPI